MVDHGFGSQVESIVDAMASCRNLSSIGKYRLVSAVSGKTETCLRWLPTALPDLERLHSIDPLRISHALRASSWSKTGTRFVMPDAVFSESIEVEHELKANSVAYSAPFEIFVDGMHFKQTRQYQHMLRQWRRNKRYFMDRVYRTEDEIDSYFVRLISTFEEIRQDGYRSQIELGGNVFDEVRVCIAPDGSVMKVSSGKHRFAIARILELPRLPVLVVGVAESWARKAIGNSQLAVPFGLNEAMKSHFGSLKS